MNRQFFSQFRSRERGQSLTEVALFLPIFVILLAGLVEVSQLVIAQNRVSNAARVGARFAANGGEDVGVVQTAFNSVTQTLTINENTWDIWSIRGTVDANGTGFDEWQMEHVYGISNTKKFPTVVEADVQADVLAELQTGGNTATAGIRLVAAYMIYDVDSILGLNALPLVENINSVEELSVMRIVGFTHEPSRGCDAYPIAVHEAIRSVTPPGTGANPFPDESDFGNGSPTPEYYEFADRYPYTHVDNVPLVDAKPGYVYKIKNGFGAGNFGWLRWNQGRPNDANTLNDSLSYPGNSTDYRQVHGGSGLPGIGRVNGYVEPNDVTDLSLNIDDWVAANTGNINSSANRNTLTDHITKDRVLRIIVWDQSNHQGNYGEYHIKGFILFRLLGYNLSGQSWILGEFMGWDNSCGQ